MKNMPNDPNSNKVTRPVTPSMFRCKRAKSAKRLSSASTRAGEMKRLDTEPD